MSTMLEQAIIDAATLREAALKNAESMIVEKYSEEVKAAVGNLLEQEIDLTGGEVTPSGEEEESTAMEQVPMAHEPSDTEEEIVVVDLDDILAAADEEEGESEEMDREEIADEIGIELELDDDPPANRSDEIEIDEGDLVEMFKEVLSLEIDKSDMEALVDEAEQEEYEKREEEAVTHHYTDGMDKEESEELKQVEAQNESLRSQNRKMKNVLQELKNKLEEINLQNARLLYTNKVLTDTSLNEQQKNKIAELVSRAKSVEESRTIFETLQKTMAHTQRKTQSLSEVVSRKSSVILSSRRKDESSSDSSDPTINRWATLAGLNKN
jgi:hypothetical protein